jgi:CDP-diacylglycerol--glycerol-3-phosphate 3-phosphatidyltransferase
MNVPNAITLIRVVVALATVSLLFLPEDSWRWLAFVLTVLVIWADGLDGYFARKLNQSTNFGAMLDIASDRVVEITYWIVFAVLGWVPLWVPLLFLVRGGLVDVVRAEAAQHGFSAFGAKTMMQGSLAKFLVASNFSRFTYAVVKAAAFCLVIAAHTAALQSSCVPTIAIGLVYAASVFCVIRGLPVLVEGSKLFSQQMDTKK